jgi:hypothetical protein
MGADFIPPERFEHALYSDSFQIDLSPESLAIIKRVRVDKKRDIDDPEP